MKKLVYILIITALVSLPAAGAVQAQDGDPVGSCPGGFTLDHFHMHDEHTHQHIGVARDINGDGYICMRHLSETLHLHVDNNLPLP